MRTESKIQILNMIKNSKNKENKYPEIRYNIAYGEWVIIAPKRSQRPQIKRKQKRNISPIESCPFEDPQKHGNKNVYLWYPKDKPIKKWKIQVFENKYPALVPYRSKKNCLEYKKSKDTFLSIKGFGYHDLLITKWHTKNFSDLSDEIATDVVRAFIKRYKQIKKNRCIKYISIFQNWGVSAGASVYHPHYQIISLPIIPNSISKSLAVSKNYYNMHHECIFCSMIRNEIKDKNRVVYKNKMAVAFVPFAAKEPYQIDIFPIKHGAFFDEMSDKETEYISDAIKKVLSMIKNNINDPDYNMIIRTAPVNKLTTNKYFHWHIEIIPKSNIDAGFELNTGMEINPLEPELAAVRIRGES